MCFKSKTLFAVCLREKTGKSVSKIIEEAVKGKL